MGSVRLGGGFLFLLSILYPHGHYASVFARKENDELRDLHVEQTRRTWDNASQSCNLFGSDKAPSYVASDQDITFFRHNRPKATITPSPEDQYWIGATSTFTPWFELLGCHVYVPIDNGYIRTLTSLAMVIGPVADCYLQCKSHFGVNVKNSLDECLRINTADDVRTYPCDTADSTGRTWTTAIIEGLSSNNGGSLQWTSFLRRRIIRWTQRTTIFLNGSACVSMKKIQNKKYEMVLRSCDYKLPSICQRRDANNTERSTHQMVTSSLTADTERPPSTVSSFVVSTVYSVTEDGGYQTVCDG
uniref:Uncharacterized protein n=1 Tax=Magallana gigas TaxID=29159 RepID=K1QNA9_MAGGI